MRRFGRFFQNFRRSSLIHLLDVLVWLLILGILLVQTRLGTVYLAIIHSIREAALTQRKPRRCRMRTYRVSSWHDEKSRRRGQQDLRTSSQLSGNCLELLLDLSLSWHEVGSLRRVWFLLTERGLHGRGTAVRDCKLRGDVQFFRRGTDFWYFRTRSRSLLLMNL